MNFRILLKLNVKNFVFISIINYHDISFFRAYWIEMIYNQISPLFFQGSCTNNSSFRVIHNIRCKNMARRTWHWIPHGASAERDANCKIINFASRLGIRKEKIPFFIERRQPWRGSGVCLKSVFKSQCH